MVGGQGEHAAAAGEEEVQPQAAADLDPFEDQVRTYIAARAWNLLVQLLETWMPQGPPDEHPSMRHPRPFLTVWRRQIHDLLRAGNDVDAAHIFSTHVQPLTTCSTIYADPGSLGDAVHVIQNWIGAHESQPNHHCDDELMLKLIMDYMRLYLPHKIGYKSPKYKKSAMWEFVVVVGDDRSHPDIRCLVCSEQVYSDCSVGTKMAAHLPVCTGLTPDARRRHKAASEKDQGSKRKYGSDKLPANKKSSLTISLPTNKKSSLTTSPPSRKKANMTAASSSDKEPELRTTFIRMKDQIDTAEGMLARLVAVPQANDVVITVGTVLAILGKLRGLASSTMGQQATLVPRASQVASQVMPRGPAVPPQVQPHAQGPPASLPVEQALALSLQNIEQYMLEDLPQDSPVPPQLLLPAPHPVQQDPAVVQPGIAPADGGQALALFPQNKAPIHGDEAPEEQPAQFMMQDPAQMQQNIAPAHGVEAFAQLLQHEAPGEQPAQFMMQGPAQMQQQNIAPAHVDEGFAQFLEHQAPADQPQDYEGFFEGLNHYLVDPSSGHVDHDVDVDDLI